MGEDVLNGAMVLILVTCVVSSLITENTARQMAVHQRVATIAKSTPVADENPDRIMMALNYPNMVGPLVELSLMLRTPHSVAPIIALNIVLENDPSARQSGEEQLERAVKLAAATNIRIQTYQRWSVNVVSGISHTITERGVSDLVLGLHQKARISDSFYGKLSTDLLAKIDRQIFIFRSMIPLNTVGRIQLLVPNKAEFEQGFARWMDRVALLMRQMACGISVYSSPVTLTAMQRYFDEKHNGLPVLYSDFKSWSDLVSLAHNSRQDHLMIFVCARRGSLSYHNYLERLPDQIERYFSSRNVLLIYPQQPTTRNR